MEDRGNFDRNEWSVSTIGTRFECGNPYVLGIHVLHPILTLILEQSIKSISRIILNNEALLIDIINYISIFNVIITLKYYACLVL